MKLHKFSKKALLLMLTVMSTLLVIIGVSQAASAKRGYHRVYKTRVGWRMPFYRHGHFIEGQQFGKTSYKRDRAGHKFHDGVDFSYSWFPKSHKIHAIHGGYVTFASDPGNLGLYNGFPTGLGKAVAVVYSPDINAYTIYQEFSPRTSDLRVQQGSWINPGKIIGIVRSDHLHLGMTSGVANPQEVGYNPDPAQDQSSWVNAVRNYSYTAKGNWQNPMSWINCRSKWKSNKRTWHRYSRHYRGRRHHRAKRR